MLIIAGLVPAAYNTIAGFTVQSLRQEQEKLKQQEAQLDLEQAKLLSYDRLKELAESLRMVDPAPQQVQYLEGKSTAEARNSLPAAGTQIPER